MRERHSRGKRMRGWQKRRKKGRRHRSVERAWLLYARICRRSRRRKKEQEWRRN